MPAAGAVRGAVAATGGRLRVLVRAGLLAARRSITRVIFGPCRSNRGRPQACCDPHVAYRYRLVVTGELGARYASAFEEMTISARDGVTEITGVITDLSVSPHKPGLPGT